MTRKKIAALAILLSSAGVAIAQSDPTDAAYKLIFSDLAKKEIEYKRPRINTMERGIFGEVYPRWTAKAIAVCVDWPNATAQSIPLKQWAFRTEDSGGFKGTDAQKSTTDGALSRCRERMGATPDCECQLLDEGGSNRLTVPPEYAEKLRKGS
ncbi:MAG: hypothetical protein U1F33_14895 [Alphaproteobacteria bacterium]